MTLRLSICIPTRNRAQHLEEALRSITDNPVFAQQDDIEVVVSDNASTDHTPQVVEKFVALYGSRVRYVRNVVDVADRNFELALRQGRGRFLKLSNDTVRWSASGLAHVRQLVEVCEDIKPLLFFLNGARRTPEPIMELEHPDALLNSASFYLTWIGSFGIWREHIEQLPDFSRCANLQLAQVDVLCRLLTQVRPIVLSNVQFGRVMDIGRKGGYSLAKVFGANYLEILGAFEGLFSAAEIAKAKRAVLVDHILPWHFNPGHDFGLYPLEEHLEPLYASEPYYREALDRARSNRKAAPTPATPASRQQSAQLWRKRNPHNETYLARKFDIDRVKVGRASYGPLDVRTFGPPDERLTVGHFVSIADGVTFILGGNHPYRGFSTFPLRVKLLGHPHEAHTKGPIVVGDDVWIGTNAMILSGVTIGQGAIIGAGTVVASDVPPYAIVVGNPMRVVKYRFSPAVIAKLLTLDFGLLHADTLIAHADKLYEELTEANIDQILEQLQQVPATPTAAVA